MKRHAVLFTVAACLATSTAEAADIGSRIGGLDFSPADLRGSVIVAANNQVTLSFVESSTFYMERGPSGERFDSERGWLPGLVISGTLMENWGVDNLYLHGSLKWVNALTTYTGSYIGGAYGDLVQKDRASVVNVDVRIGKGFDVFDDVMLTPYAGLGWRDWARTLSGPGGYREDYRHAYAGAGALLQWSPAKQWVIGVNGLVGRTFAAEMATTPIPGGFPMPADEFRLGSSTLYMAGASLDYAVTNNVHLAAGVDYLGFRYGRSQPNVYGLYEPDSRTDDVSVKIGVGYSF